MKWLMIFSGAVVGGAVALVLTVVIAFVIFRWWIRRKLGNVMEQLQTLAATADTVPPFRLDLHPGLNDAWNADLAEPLFTPLLERGFVEAGEFHSDSTPNSTFSIKAFASPEHNAWGAVFHHAQAGYWLELLTQYADGTTLTFSTSKPHGMDNPNYVQMENRPAAEADELFDEFLAAQSKPAKAVDPAQFAEVFCAAYARSMDWRMARGGVTRAEVERQIEKMGETNPDQHEEMIGMIQGQWRSRINEFYDEQLRENFIQASKLEPRKWEKIRDKLVFVHDRLTGDELFERIESVLDLWDDEDADEDAIGALQEQLEQLAHQGKPRDVFPQIAELLASHRQVAKFGTLKRPVATDVYGITAELPIRSPRAIEHSDE